MPTPTPRELEILKVLWEDGPSSVRAVHRRLMLREPDLAYNTVQTLLRLMEVKCLVGHDLDGRTFIYDGLLQPRRKHVPVPGPGVRRGGFAAGAEPAAKRAGVGVGAGADSVLDRRGAAEGRTAVGSGGCHERDHGDGLAAAHSGGRGPAVAGGLDVGGVDAPAGAAAARGRVGRGGVAAAGRPQPRPGLARGDDAGAFRAGRDCTPTLFNR